MPCYDHRDHDPHYVHMKCREKIDGLADMLCRLMTAVDLDLEYSITVPPDIEDWWKEHQIKDRERKEAGVA